MTQGTMRDGDPGSGNVPFVWSSTDESVSTNTVSILACIEVAVAVTAYWAIAIHFETFTHLWVSICAAPLLLLRSERSIALGVNWFERYFDRSEDLERASYSEIARSIEFWVGLLVAAIGSSLASYLLAELFLAHSNRWPLLLRGTLVGAFVAQFIIILVAAVGPHALTNTPRLLLFLSITATFVAGTAFLVGAEAYGVIGLIFGVIIIVASGIIDGLLPSKVKLLNVLYPLALPFTLGGILGIVLRSVAIRFAATAVHIWIGFWEIPKNFYQTLFVVDVRHRAELIPGYKGGGVLDSDKFLHARRETVDSIGALGAIAAFVVFFAPAYAYRLSIKSTCWLYLPLVYVARERFDGRRPAYILQLLDERKEIGRRVLAVITLGSFVAITAIYNLDILPRLFSKDFASPIEALFVIDYQFWRRPWQVLNLLSAGITVYLFFEVGDARLDGDNANVEWLKFLMRVRDVSSMLLILILLMHSLLKFSPLMCWTPTFVIQKLDVFYGEYMPEPPRCRHN